MALDPSSLKTLAIELAAAMPPLFDAPPALPVIDQSPRARAIRRISAIAAHRGWQLEITRTLDKHRASYVSELTDDAIDSLCTRMEKFEDCVQCGCDLQDAPPAS